MLTSFQTAYKTIVFTKNSEPRFPVARFIDFVINPDTGIFEAIWVESPEGLKIILPQDIVQWDENEILITDEQEILDSDSLPRLRKVLDKEIAILGAKVFAGKTPLGEVIDFAFDTISPRLLSITVKSGFWIFGEKRVIRQDQILKITKEGIFVTEPKVKISNKKEEAVKKGQMADLGD